MFDEMLVWDLITHQRIILEFSLLPLKSYLILMQIQWESGAGYIQINGIRYYLKQCHWHSPSEHAINGRKYALESHMLHESLDGKVAVVGIVYKIGRPDSFLSSVSTIIYLQTTITAGCRRHLSLSLKYILFIPFISADRPFNISGRHRTKRD